MTGTEALDRATPNGGDATRALASPSARAGGIRRCAHLRDTSVRRPYYSDESVTLYAGHALEVARDLGTGAVDCIVTSPPFFGLRDYGVEGQYGAENSPGEYVENLRALFSELRRALADDGTLWLTLGDSYSGSAGRTTTGDKSTLRGNGHVGGGPKPRARAGRRSSRRASSAGEPAHGVASTELAAKNLIGIPRLVALALQDDGWILRSSIVWSKSNAMPESVSDRPSNRYEHVFLFAKSQGYWFDLDAIRIRTTSREDALSRDRDIDLIPGQRAQHRRGRTWDQRKASGATSRHGKCRPAQVSDSDFSTSAEGRSSGDVWTFPTQPFPGAHFTVMPPALAQQCVLSGCKPGGTVLDPCSGSGTTGLAAQRSGRRYVGVDLKPAYLELSLRTRLRDAALVFEEGA